MQHPQSLKRRVPQCKGKRQPDDIELPLCVRVVQECLARRVRAATLLTITEVAVAGELRDVLRGDRATCVEAAITVAVAIVRVAVTIAEVRVTVTVVRAAKVRIAAIAVVPEALIVHAWAFELRCIRVDAIAGIQARVVSLIAAHCRESNPLRLPASVPC